MAERVEALVKPELLAWARETAGLSIAAAARKAQVDPDRLQSWELGARRPTVNQLRKLAGIYKRPLAVFYLPEPPATLQPIHDFRRLPGKVAGKQSPELRLAVRLARQRRQLALDLYEDLEGTPPTFTASADLTEGPEIIGTRIRSLLGITYEEQAGWQGDYDAFNRWRSALETAGALVFQATDVQVGEMRGFSISETPLPAVVVNIKDQVRGRIFTMLHEFAHLMIREGGLCDLEEDQHRPPEEQGVEVFCNHVAGAALVPMESLLQEEIVTEKRGGAVSWSDEEIDTLARRYRAGRETVLRRLLIDGRTTEGFYRRKRAQFQREYEERERPAGGFVPPYRMALSSAGTLFARLVLDGYYRERITASDLSEYLEVRLKHLPRIEQELVGPGR